MLHFKIYYGVLNLPLVFFSDLHFLLTFFLLLTFLSINGTSTLRTNVCLTTGIPQQFLSCCLDVLVNFGQIFALFLGAFIVDLEYYLFIVNVINCYLMTYLCGTPKRRYIYGSCCCKTLVSNCANDIGKTCSKPLMRFNNHIFYVLFFFTHFF